MMKEACEKRTTNILDISGKKYAFDSTTIPLCLATVSYTHLMCIRDRNRTQFNNYVRKYDGNRYVKHFNCWNQMLAMMFGQLSNRESLREADDQHP